MLRLFGLLLQLRLPKNKGLAHRDNTALAGVEGKGLLPHLAFVSRFKVVSSPAPDHDAFTPAFELLVHFSCTTAQVQVCSACCTCVAEEFSTDTLLKGGHIPHRFQQPDRVSSQCVSACHLHCVCTLSLLAAAYRSCITLRYHYSGFPVASPAEWLQLAV